MNVAQIRSLFLDYFKSKTHLVVPSASLIPEHDATLLFTNAGMVPFKNFFTGQAKPPATKVCSVQKCVRAGGKHNDLENVGFTSRHHTFFEMLGNFSFGDYFKKDAIAYAYEFATKSLKLDPEKIYVTVYESDQEAYDLWTKTIKPHVQDVSQHLFYLGEKDNFWAMGPTGPCGPCSELYIDQGPELCAKSQCSGCQPGDDHCERFLEFWNLVFMQFDRQENGDLLPLAHPCVDTGAGLERLAAILQGKTSNFESDLFQPLLKKITDLYGVPYEDANRSTFHVLADHARCGAFLIADGVFVSNEGRGYVLRRILRRAIRFAKKLNPQVKCFEQLCLHVCQNMGDLYPELRHQQALIEEMVKAEEEIFSQTLAQGEELFEKETAQAKQSTVPGAVAFKLYDTYGFPLDLTELMAKERGMTVDLAGYEQELAKQRQRSQKAWKGSGQDSLDAVYTELADKISTDFKGYDTLKLEAKLLKRIVTKDHLELVFDQTPFYPEGGGQVGDQGWIQPRDHQGEPFAVTDTQKPCGDLVVHHLDSKALAQADLFKEGAIYTLKVNEQKRQATAKNHSATHLLHWALRKTLGAHVKQAGSLVNPESLRFDFTHFQALTKAELQQIESLVNNEIFTSYPVSINWMSKDEAVNAGAIAMFGEKYGQTVRVIKMGSESIELCGGTHVGTSGEIQGFKILNESSVGAGVRRIYALTSARAFAYLNEKAQFEDDVLAELKVKDSASAFESIQKFKQKTKELQQLQGQINAQKAAQLVDDILQQTPQSWRGHNVYYHYLDERDAAGMKELRGLGEKLGKKAQDAAFVLVSYPTAGAPGFLVICRGSENSMDCGAMLKETAQQLGGRGGGKKDFAQAGNLPFLSREDFLKQTR